MPFSFKFAYNICYLFREIVFSSLIFLVLLMIVIFINNVASQEPVPCARKYSFKNGFLVKFTMRLNF